MGEKPGESGNKPPDRGGRDEGEKTGTGYKGSRPWPTRRGAFRKPVVQQAKFEGKCAELKGCIYDCTDSKQADVFTKTTKEIANYVGTTYKYGNDVKLAVSTLRTPSFTEPSDPPEGASKSKLKIWETKISDYCKRESYLEENLKTLYSLVWGQCTDLIRARIEALDAHKQMFEDGDSIGLLIAIKALVYNYQSQKYKPLALHENMRRFYLIYQERNMTCQAYMEKFQNTVDVLDHCGAGAGNMPGLLQAILEESSINPDNATKEQVATALQESQERYLAVAFLLGADKARYGRLLENMENDYAQGVDRYPRTVIAAYNTISSYKQDARYIMQINGSGNDGLAFAQGTGDEGKEKKYVDRTKVTCFKCGVRGHYAT